MNNLQQNSNLIKVGVVEGLIANERTEYEQFQKIKSVVGFYWPGYLQICFNLYASLLNASIGDSYTLLD